jgi:Trypsin-like peptidase domain
MTKVFIPAGRLSSKKRDFQDVVADARHAVFSVHRIHPLANGQAQVTVLGSGFFVSSTVFITCWHVINNPASPHQAGDAYHLVNNLNGTNGYVHVVKGDLGVDIHLYPDHDFAILISKSKLDQAYLPISYADVPTGHEIGVAGYPIPSLVLDAAGNISLGGLVYRVAKGVATAVYKTDLDCGLGHPLKGVEVLEVNFLFVPGNSGGPIFDAATGRVEAFVEGFREYKIKEKEEHFGQAVVPSGLPGNYLQSIYAVYSIGLRLLPVRQHLEQFGVQL